MLRLEADLLKLDGIDLVTASVASVDVRIKLLPRLLGWNPGFARPLAPGAAPRDLDPVHALLSGGLPLIAFCQSLAVALALAARSWVAV